MAKKTMMKKKPRIMVQSYSIVTVLLDYQSNNVLVHVRNLCCFLKVFFLLMYGKPCPSQLTRCV